MRIISGTARGTKLKAPRGMAIRPTSDRVKESVFNILAGFISDARVLDIFAGTGNLGLESLSRGANRAVFVDQSPASISLIKQNALLTKLVERVEIHRGDAFRFLERLTAQGELFDLIFCDPPYNQGYVGKVVDYVDKHRILSPGGVLIIEHSRHEAADLDTLVKELCRLSVWRIERYGETLVTFFVHNKTN